MYTCYKCGAVMEEDQRPAHRCGVPDGSDAATAEVTARTRPDGQTPIFYGQGATGIGFIITVVAGFLMAQASNEPSYASDLTLYEAAADVAFYWNWVVFGSGLLSLGILVWSVGYIVQAISFLPGKED